MTRQKKRVATDTRRSPGCRTTPLEHCSTRKPTVEPRWVKQQTKKFRPQPIKINCFMSGPSMSLTPDPPKWENVTIPNLMQQRHLSILNFISVGHPSMHTQLCNPRDTAAADNRQQMPAKTCRKQAASADMARKAQQPRATKRNVWSNENLDELILI